IGIADASCSFNTDQRYWNEDNQKKTVRFLESGHIKHITLDKKRNQRYDDNQMIAAEVDLRTEPRKVSFFINNQEQVNSVVGIPGSIRFIVYTLWRSASFTVTKFLKYDSSSVGGVSGSNSLDWGKEWISEDEEQDQGQEEESEGLEDKYDDVKQ
ncbi:MAG: hypothetical protein EZS28_050647, partial [Streblomastix strix]